MELEKEVQMKTHGSLDAMTMVVGTKASEALEQRGRGNQNVRGDEEQNPGREKESAVNDDEEAEVKTERGRKKVESKVVKIAKKVTY